MSKVLQLLQDALIEIGVYAPADTIPAVDIQFALRTFNRMMSLWNTEELTVYSVNRTAFNLVAGQQTYTLGTGGDFNIPRPVRVDSASVLITANQPYPLEIPIEILNDQQWQNLSLKQTPSVFPVYCWITGDMPLNNVWFWPVPQDSTVQFVMYAWGQVQPFTSLTTEVSLPNGYDEAIVSNLALMLSPSYGVTPSNILVQRALSSKSSLQSQNIEPMYAGIDRGLGRGNGFTLAVQTQGLLVDR